MRFLEKFLGLCVVARETWLVETKFCLNLTIPFVV